MEKIKIYYIKFVDGLFKSIINDIVYKENRYIKLNKEEQEFINCYREFKHKYETK